MRNRGFLLVLLVLVLLGLAVALNVDPLPSMVLIDDVERSLHPRGQRELMGAIRELQTARPEVQIAVLTAQIKDLTEHMHRHPKDYHSRHGLLLKVNRRNKLGEYLRRVDAPKFAQLAAKLGLRK